MPVGDISLHGRTIAKNTHTCCNVCDCVIIYGVVWRRLLCDNTQWVVPRQHIWWWNVQCCAELLMTDWWLMTIIASCAIVVNGRCFFSLVSQHADFFFWKTFILFYWLFWFIWPFGRGSWRSAGWLAAGCSLVLSRRIQVLWKSQKHDWTKIKRMCVLVTFVVRLGLLIHFRQR